MFNAPHGIIQVGRSYADGPRDISDAQARRITQEIIRDLAQYVPDVNIEVVLTAFTDGLDESGLSRHEMTALLRFYDAVKAGMVGTAEQPSMVDLGATPSIIRSLRAKRGSNAAYIPTTSEEDKQLVAALLESRQVRVALMNGNAAFDAARELVAQVINGEYLNGDDVPVLLDFFEDAQHPERAAKRRQVEAKRAELERIQRELAQLEAAL